jgi:hypothetical protein
MVARSIRATVRHWQAASRGFLVGSFLQPEHGSTPATSAQWSLCHSQLPPSQSPSPSPSRSRRYKVAAAWLVPTAGVTVRVWLRTNELLLAWVYARHPH